MGPNGVTLQGELFPELDADAGQGYTQISAAARPAGRDTISAL
jgi:hypothetical protein